MITLRDMLPDQKLRNLNLNGWTNLNSHQTSLYKIFVKLKLEALLFHNNSILESVNHIERGRWGGGSRMTAMYLLQIDYIERTNKQ